MRECSLLVPWTAIHILCMVSLESIYAVTRVLRILPLLVANSSSLLPFLWYICLLVMLRLYCVASLNGLIVEPRYASTSLTWNCCYCCYCRWKTHHTSGSWTIFSERLQAPSNGLANAKLSLQVLPVNNLSPSRLEQRHNWYNYHLKTPWVFDVFNQESICTRPTLRPKSVDCQPKYHHRQSCRTTNSFSWSAGAGALLIEHFASCT